MTSSDVPTFEAILMPQNHSVNSLSDLKAVEMLAVVKGIDLMREARSGSVPRTFWFPFEPMRLMKLQLVSGLFPGACDESYKFSYPVNSRRMQKYVINNLS